MNIRTGLGAFALATGLLGGPAVAGDLRTHEIDVTESLSAGTTLEVDGLLGSIVATAAPGERATIHARVTAHEADPARVTIRATHTSGRVVICAAYPDDVAGDCRHRSHPGEHRAGDIAVDFTLTVPANVRLVANSVSGNVRAVGLRGDVTVATVHGNVTLATTGRSDATAVDGSLDVHLSQTDWTGEQRFRTVNGPIRLTLARSSNVTLDAGTLNGAIRGERGLALETHDGTYVGHSGTATLGKGGSRISLHTVNGEISVGFD